jgi:hypothetical protein
MSKMGTIRSREARDVVEDVFRQFKLAKPLYSHRAGAFHVLVGARVVEIPTPRGLTFYGLQNLQQEAEKVCRDVERARANRNQLDIEQAIEAAE